MLTPPEPLPPATTTHLPVPPRPTPALNGARSQSRKGAQLRPPPSSGDEEDGGGSTPLHSGRTAMGALEAEPTAPAQRTGRGAGSGRPSGEGAGLEAGPGGGPRGSSAAAPPGDRRGSVQAAPCGVLGHLRAISLGISPAGSPGANLVGAELSWNGKRL